MPKSIAEGREKVTVLDEAPELPTDGSGTIPAATLNAGQDASCNLARNGHRMSATASDTVSDPAVCDEGNKSVLGASNYEWTWVPFRYFDADTGQPESTEDWLFDLVRDKGATVVAAQRKSGKRSDEDWASGDEGYLWIGVNDNPQDPTDTGGYQKVNVPFSDIQRIPFTVGS